MKINPKDGLPYDFLISKIAEKMGKYPKKPKLKLRI